MSLTSLMAVAIWYSPSETPRHSKNDPLVSEINKDKPALRGRPAIRRKTSCRVVEGVNRSMKSDTNSLPKQMD